MEFKQFNEILEQHVALLTDGEEHLFVTGASTRDLWHEYLESFPPGTNEVYRERREYDCQCCCQFVRTFGNVVAIKDGMAVSIWDFKVGDPKYQTVVNALAKMVHSFPVQDVFVPTTRVFGTKKSREMALNQHVRSWYHFHAKVADSVKTYREDQVGGERGRMRDIRNVLQRSLSELSLDAIDTVLDLIGQKSLYKGEEWSGVLTKFRAMHVEYSRIKSREDKNNYCWTTSLKAGAALSKIKNHSIGVLLSDITEGKGLDAAVRSYEKIVAPSNYKRPRAIFTKKMVEAARAKVEELGLAGSLGRRFAKLGDITVNNVLFANRDAAKEMAGDAFDELAQTASARPRSLDKIEEVGIDTFVQDVLPGLKEIEVLLENRHSGNRMSLIAPKDPDSKSLFKWSNGFSWAYSGNITDSEMRDRVKAAGGKVDGVLRFSIQWNDNGDCRDDLDAHCHEPRPGAHIYFRNKACRHPSSGMLDVDVVDPGPVVAVENITWEDKSRMPGGVYKMGVHNYASRGGRSGFTAEIEFDGKVYSFSYGQSLRQDQVVNVAEVTLKDGEFSIREVIPSSMSSRDMWGLPSEQFHPVSAFMYSPNYWDGQEGIGHRHYFFMLRGFRNDENPNGFFNEFLKEDFMAHKRVFEALGAKMNVEDAEDQLSGLGFSSTKRASLICKVKGSFERVIKLTF